MESPVIIAIKGSPSTAKRKLALSVAEKLRCPIMDPNDLFPALKQRFGSVQIRDYQFSDEAVLLMAKVQLQLKLSVVVNSPLSYQSDFDKLVTLAASNDATLLLIDCREDEYSLQDYDVGDFNMLILLLDTDEDEVGKELVSKALQFIASGSDRIADSRSRGKEVEEEEDQEEKKNNSEDDERVLKDFAHSDHPLVFCDDDDNGVSCKACLKPIRGPTYSCVDCQFFLHKSCAELPFKIQSPVDNVHGPLFLSMTPDLPIIFPNCMACGDASGNCFYWSRSEGFTMDPKCTKLASKIEPEFHQHPLYLQFGRFLGPDLEPKLRRPFQIKQRKLLFSCNACGNICDHIHYACSECDLDLHIQCALLPITIKHKCHCDPFTLTTSSPLDDSGEYYCDVCEERREAEHWFYYCSDCDYFAHLSCIISEISPYPASEDELKLERIKEDCKKTGTDMPLNEYGSITYF